MANRRQALADTRTPRRLGTLFALWQFLLPYKARLLAATAALVFTALVTLAIGQGVKLVIDSGFASGSAAQLQQAVLVLAGLTFIMAIGTFVRFYLVSWLGERVAADLRTAVFDHLITLHPGWFETNRSGEIMSRLTTDTTLLQSIIGSSISMALRSALTLAGGLVMLLVTNFKLTLVLVCSVPVVLLPILVYGRRVRSLSRRSQDSIAEVGTYAGEIIQQLKTVQSYNREDYESSAFHGEVEKAFAIANRRVRQRAIMVAAVIMLVFGAMAVMLWIGGTDVLSGAMTGGELGAFVFYAMLVASGVATWSEVYGELQRAAGATDRLLELMRVRPLIGPPAAPLPADGLTADIRFRDVTFCYPSRPDQPALEHLDLYVPAGTVLALVGPSGAGKSTLFELLQRFHDPGAGRIELGGVDIRQLHPAALRARMAVVSQQPALFSTDILRNIRYGRPEASDQEVEAAARAAHAHDFILRLPDGYYSHVGERGVRLSGGQQQRIAIARALLKDPHILLLDEATSALDAESELQVQKALEVLMRDRTTIIIAHRLSTILHAHNIAVLDHGQLVAQGTHRQLLDSCELYRRLAALQFRDEPTPVGVVAQEGGIGERNRKRDGSIL